MRDPATDTPTFRVRAEAIEHSCRFRGLIAWRADDEVDILTHRARPNWLHPTAEDLGVVLYDLPREFVSPHLCRSRSRELASYVERLSELFRIRRKRRTNAKEQKIRFDSYDAVHSVYLRPRLCHFNADVAMNALLYHKAMHNAYAVLGIGFVILFATIYVINSRFTKSPDTGIINVSTSTMHSSFALKSPAFGDGARIPSQYTCDEDQPSPPLSIAGTPKGTKSFALLMEDPDVPKQIKPDGLFVHWILFNIPAETIDIPENAVLGAEGMNGSGKQGYVGPCPPTQYEPSKHRYFFHLYALDTELDLQPGATKEELLHAMEGHILEETQLIGTYKRS